jgi:radical SAM superfamily enzyme YgiQ (UPF0313 family)
MTSRSRLSTFSNKLIFLSVLRDTGCLFVTSAVKYVNDEILRIFGKNHTREDFVNVVALFQKKGLILNPTFVTFTPWTSPKDYFDLLELIRKLDLIENVSPIQYAIRLLIPRGSRLLELSEVREPVEAFDEEALSFPWSHSDARVDALYEDVLSLVKEGMRASWSRNRVFQAVWSQAARYSKNGRQKAIQGLDRLSGARSRAEIPNVNEPWYC